MDGLIIKKKWIDKILSGEKTLEVRGTRTNKVGEEIYLFESGSKKVRGTAEIDSCFKVTREAWEEFKELHCVEITYDELLYVYKEPYFWKLKNAYENIEDWHYVHPAGAVIWVKNPEFE